MSVYIDRFLRLADTYRATTDISESWLSTLIFNDGKRIRMLRAGEADLTTGSLEKATQILADKWPDDLEWPDDIARPPRTETVEAAG